MEGGDGGDTNGDCKKEIETGVVKDHKGVSKRRNGGWKWRRIE